MGIMQTQKPYHEMDDIYLYLDTPELEDIYNKMKPLADAGDPNAACVIGWYHTNMGTTANIPWGIKYLVRALDGDYREEAIECLLKRGNEELLLHGNRIKDMLLFISLSDESREEKDMVNALLTLYYVHHVYFVDDNTKYFDLIGEKYYDNLLQIAWGIERNAGSTIAILEYLSGKKDNQAMSYLGLLLLRGDVVPQNVLRAYHMFHEVYYNTRWSHSAWMISEIYLSGDLFAADYSMALRWGVLAYCEAHGANKDVYEQYMSKWLETIYAKCPKLWDGKPILFIDDAARMKSDIYSDREKYVSSLPDPYEYIKTHQRSTESQPNTCKKDDNNGKAKSKKKQTRKKDSSS